MTIQQIFSAWAPPSSIWSAWAKPVLFSYLPAVTFESLELHAVNVAWAGRADGATAMVIDIPGVESLTLGVSLAAAGFRPVPLYNACPEQRGDTPLVEVRPVMNALVGAAASLLNLRLPDDAPPVFLLDSNRRTSRIEPAPGMLDNRSISLPTDFPSGTLMRHRGIQRIILVQSESAIPQADLSHTLRRWQDSGLLIALKVVNQRIEPQPITIQKPRAFGVLWYNLLATMGLRSSPLGGFGGRLPLPGAG